MKNLNDFISEEDKKKESVRPVKDSKRGADDQKYVRLMENIRELVVEIRMKPIRF